MEKVWWVCEDRPLEHPLPDEQELLSESESESLQLHEPLSEPCSTQLHTSGSQSSNALVTITNCRLSSTISDQIQYQCPDS
jgi:hypothetical protein